MLVIGRSMRTLSRSPRARPPPCRTFSCARAAWARSKVYGSPAEAVADMKSNSTLLSGGFGLCGVPDDLIAAIRDNKGIRNLTAVSNNAGADGTGLGLLLESGQIVKMVASYIGENRTFERMYLSGELELDLTPQGTLAERIRCGGAGVPAFYTPAGVGTPVETGGIPSRYDGRGGVLSYQPAKETRTFGGRTFLLERAIEADYAVVKCHRADTAGNLQFRLAAENFNGVMARNARVTIVEAEEIVDVGGIDPNRVHVPGVYVDRVVRSTAPKRIEKLTLSRGREAAMRDLVGGGGTDAGEALAVRERIVRRAAREFEDGMAANLGIGMPMLAPAFCDDALDLSLQSENGILGLGRYPEPGAEDADLINAGKETVTVRPGASFFGSAESFGMIRAGRIGVTMLGAMQVSRRGDLANWAVPGGRVRGMGGAMDLCANPRATRIVVLTTHTARGGRHKILEACDFPLTGARCVSRIITELCVFDVDPEAGLLLVELADGVTVDVVRQNTGAPFAVSPDLKSMEG